MQGEAAIFWWALGIGLFGVVFFCLKVGVVWDSCHNLQDGGVPTLDFPIVCPAPLAMSAWLFLSYFGQYPFRGFGFVVYLALAVTFGLMFWVIELHGRPIRRVQLRRLEAEFTARERDAGRSAAE